jgi:hypothetical protein
LHQNGWQAASNSAAFQTLYRQKSSAAQYGFSISRISGVVMEIATCPPQNPAGCCSSDSPYGPAPVAVTSAIVTSERFLRRPPEARLQETGAGRKISRFNQQ